MMVLKVWSLEHQYQHHLGFVRNTNTWGGRGMVRELDWLSGISRCKLLHIKWVNNKVLQYSTGNYFQLLLFNR